MKLKLFLVAFLTLVSVSATLYAAESKEFDVCWSHYTGWEPWAYADEKGILKKWADKFGIKIKLTLVNDYIESINLYTTGKYQACTMTNMDALTIPAVGGIDSTALIVGDFSNGNDGILTKEEKSVKELKGKSIKLVQLSVSHYLLSRALEMNGLAEKDVTLVNASDADIGSLFISDPKAVVVTWNPILMSAKKDKNAKIIFDSSKIPGEIIDLMVVRTDAPDTLKKALVGAWFETMKMMNVYEAKDVKAATEAIEFMAKKAGSSALEFKAQLQTTSMFYDAKKAVEFTKSKKLIETMDYVRSFSFDHGLYGQGAKSKDLVGMEFPGGKILGDPKNIKLRFNATYMSDSNL
ncbi:MAG: ABC transporter substrate-binding protein [Oligoflexia bacterium]|nr:ABC transporter substrate-binding protein [Oligoflexia bacterium]